MNQATTKERRRVPRFPFHAQASLRIGEELLFGKLLDISYNGALFSHASPPAANRGDDCLLTLTGSGVGTRDLAIHGYVAFVQTDTVGIEFRRLGHEELAGLMSIIELNLGVPSLLERNLDNLATQSAGGTA